MFNSDFLETTGIRDSYNLAMDEGYDSDDEGDMIYAKRPARPEKEPKLDGATKSQIYHLIVT